MDFVDLVRTASKGDVKAFVALTRRFQHLAFGSAFALLHDFQLAEDVTQDAFIAVWSALPKLSDPAAFPGWLRTIVRHCAFRILRRRQLDFVSLTEAAEVASEEPTPDRVFAARHQCALMLRALADLSPELREPATLFYIHDCSQPDIAAFLNLPVTTTACTQPVCSSSEGCRQWLKTPFHPRVCRMTSRIGSAVRLRRGAAWWMHSSTRPHCPTC